MNSTYGVYIIESIHSDEYEDGENLDRILNMAKITSIYHHVEAKEALAHHLKDFVKSNLRYLYLSCHADLTGVFINGDKINYEFISETLKGGMNRKRVFMSACEGANAKFASLLICEAGAMSLIGSPIEIALRKAAIFWPAFFSMMHDVDDQKMNRSILKVGLQRCCDFFQLPINYYSLITKKPTHLRRLKIRFNKMPLNKVIKSKV